MDSDGAARDVARERPPHLLRGRRRRRPPLLPGRRVLEDREERGRLLRDVRRVERDPDRDARLLQLVRGGRDALECGRRRVVAAEDERVRVSLLSAGGTVAGESVRMYCRMEAISIDACCFLTLSS